MHINEYKECEEIFWNENSFYHALHEERIWKVEKYWSLEYYLIKLASSLGETKVLQRELAANLHYLSRGINIVIENQKLPSSYWEASSLKLKNFNEDEGYECIDRFNHIMQIIWGRIPLEYGDTLLKNPLIKRGD